MEVDPKILPAIENAIAASRWRIAARFEGQQTAKRYRALAEERSRAATRLCSEIVAATTGSNGGAKVAGDEADHPRLADDGHHWGAGCARGPQAE